MRILIAEDDLVSRRVLQKNIEMWGHEVLVAKDGLEAWKMSGSLENVYRE